MAAKQPWALDSMSFGLAYPDRRLNQDGRTIQEVGREASGGRKGPRPRSGRAPPLSLRCRSIGHRLSATVSVVPLLVVLVQRLKKCHQEVAVIGRDERDSSQGISAIAKGIQPGLIRDPYVEADDVF